MLEQLLVWERESFFLLNGSDSAFLDRFMWLYSSKAVWVPLAVFILAVLFYKKNWKESLLILVAIVLVITLCDQFSSHLCKPLFTRLRPTHHPDFMEQVKVVFDYRGGRYGFISSHAANAFGFATFMALLFRDKLFGYTVFAWAILNAYTRVYLGVHFITDIIPGAISGWVFGASVYYLYIYVRPRLIPGAVTSAASIYPESRKRMITFAIWLTALILFTCNDPLVSCLR